MSAPLGGADRCVAAQRSARSACHRGTKVPAPSCGFAGAAPGGGRHGQADQRVAAADLHGDVRRERHIRRNPASLSRRANLVRAGASFVGIAFAVLAACPFRGRVEKRAAGNGPAACRFRPHRRRSRGRFTYGRARKTRLRPFLGQAGGCIENRLKNETIPTRRLGKFLRDRGAHSRTADEGDPLRRTARSSFD
jgi:hypothetical protein